MGADHAVQPTMLVAQAGRELRAVLGDPDRVAEAAERLATTAEASIAQLDRAGAERGIGVALVPEDAETLLAATLGQLEVAGTMFAASEVVGEHETGEPGHAEPGVLDEPLRRLDATVALLAEPQPLATQGIGAQAATASTTVAEAVAALRRQLGRTVEDIIARSTAVIGDSLTGIRDRGPDAVRKAWDMVNERLHLDRIGGKLARLGLRAFRSALDMLARIVPGGWLGGIREQVDRMIASVDRRGAGKTVVAMAIGADRLSDQQLDRSGLDMAKLDRGTADLAGLGAKYGKLMDLCGGIGTAIGFAVKLTAVLRLALPQLAVLIMAAHLLVIGSVIVLGRDHVDAGPDLDAGRDGPGLVRGVRTIVGEATA